MPSAAFPCLPALKPACSFCTYQQLPASRLPPLLCWRAALSSSAISFWLSPWSCLFCFFPFTFPFFVFTFFCFFLFGSCCSLFLPALPFLLLVLPPLLPFFPSFFPTFPPPFFFLFLLFLLFFKWGHFICPPSSVSSWSKHLCFLPRRAPVWGLFLHRHIHTKPFCRT